MNIFEPFLSLLVGRATVTPRVLNAAPATLVKVLNRKKFIQASFLSDSAKIAIVQEALRRAAERENDNVARMNPFYDQIEDAADNIIAAFNGDSGADPRIKSILEFHKLL